MSMDAIEERKAAALRILGQVVAFHHRPDGPFYCCTLMDAEGMVEVAGFAGRFAPHLFVLAPKSAIAVVEKSWI